MHPAEWMDPAHYSVSSIAMIKREIRPEEEIFSDLAELCTRPGYIHALAYLCFRDNIIMYSGKMQEVDLQDMYNPGRLIRTEINTLAGLMVKEDIEWGLQSPDVTQGYIERSESLLKELHDSMNKAMFSGMGLEGMENGKIGKFSAGDALREPIFYGGESAYIFQYQDMAVKKYASDNGWLKTNQGFTIEDACAVEVAVQAILSEQMHDRMVGIGQKHPDEWTYMPLFSFSVDDVATKTGLPLELTERVLLAFTLPDEERNSGFNELHDFNRVCATPLLRAPNDDFLCLQSYAMAEAVYDTPFYWMAQDKEYLPALTKNRGDFTEQFTADRLAQVFGLNNVYKNVFVNKSKKERHGEIDVLVVWGNRAIVIQAKSKRLTLEARKGNDQVIRDDFKKSVQDSYDQAAMCAVCVGDPEYSLSLEDGTEVKLSYDIKETYILCVVSDHYPALAVQARQFLKTKQTGRVQKPVVLDVFAIDAITEMLSSPLYLLSYLNRRANYADQVLAAHELTILAYHLNKNLWIGSKFNFIQLDDDLSAGLDIAMSVRRIGVEGDPTPDGILTRFKNTTLGKIVDEIEERSEPATIDLGFMLLELNEDTVVDISSAIDRLSARSRADGEVHDISAQFGIEDSGLTVHCSKEPLQHAVARLERYCVLRKYKQHAGKWFGLCLDPQDSKVRFGVNLVYPWEQDDDLDKATENMKEPTRVDNGLKELFGSSRGGLRRRQKIGRNQPCPCGSGKKYKKCCLKIK